MFVRTLDVWGALVVSLVLVGCGGSGPGQTATASVPASAPAAAAVRAPAAPADPSNPCTLVPTADINTILGSSLEDGTRKADDARQIVVCTWNQQPYGTLNITVSLTPGEAAYKTNWDLAPAYFDGDAEQITVAGAEKAYQVNRKDKESFVIGLLVKGRFALVQVGYIKTATAAQAVALAERVASRM